MRSSSSSAESKQAIQPQTNVLADKTTPAEPKTELTPLPVAEKTPETSAVSETSPTTAESDKTAPAIQSSFKNKPVAAPVATPRVAKPAAPPVKAPANQKKAVTVDDIINGN
jgi:hypothetical protein